MKYVLKAFIVILIFAGIFTTYAFWRHNNYLRFVSFKLHNNIGLEISSIQLTINNSNIIHVDEIKPRMAFVKEIFFFVVPAEINLEIKYLVNGNKHQEFCRKAPLLFDGLTSNSWIFSYRVSNNLNQGC